MTETIIPDRKPLYITWVCPSCHSIRRFRPIDSWPESDDIIYGCPVCEQKIRVDFYGKITLAN